VLPWSEVRAGATELRRELSADEVSDFAASLSYRFLLALFPLFIFLTALGGFVAAQLEIANPAVTLIDRVGERLPADARSLLQTELAEVLEHERPGLLSGGIIAALWAASGGMSATMRAMNRAYDVEETRPFWKRVLLSVGLTLFTGVFFLAAFVLAIAGQAVGTAAAEALRLGEAFEALTVVIRFVGMVVGLLIAVSAVYWAAPDANLSFRFVTLGSVLFVAAWLIGSLLFAWYVSMFGSYNATYGALGGVVVLMVWFYLTAYMLLVGAELNAILKRHAEPQEALAPNEDGTAATAPDASMEWDARVHRNRRTRAPLLASRATGLVVAAAALWRASTRRKEVQPP
jgi:membrane protein